MGYVEEFKAFVSDKRNYKNCSACPENEGHSSWPGNRLPCGQFKCWVELHHQSQEEDE